MKKENSQDMHRPIRKQTICQLWIQNSETIDLFFTIWPFFYYCTRTQMWWKNVGKPFSDVPMYCWDLKTVCELLGIFKVRTVASNNIRTTNKPDRCPWNLSNNISNMTCFICYSENEHILAVKQAIDRTNLIIFLVLLQVTSPQQLQLPQHQHGRDAPSVHLNSDLWSSLPS